MKNTQPCKICKMKIHLNRDDYLHLKDYKAGQFFEEGYYHNKCFREKLESTKGIKDRAMSLLQGAEKMMKQAGFTPEEKVYEIPTQ